MAHLLYRFGARALTPRKAPDGRSLPPMISVLDAMKLRERYYAMGQPWPFEGIVPGPPKPPAGAQAYLERQKAKQETRLARAKEISDAMARMPKAIQDYRASRRLVEEEVSALDRLTLSRGQMYEKYVKRRLMKQG